MSDQGFTTSSWKRPNIVVPADMLKAAMESRKQIDGQVVGWSDGMCRQVLEAALCWLYDNFIRPTDEQFGEMVKERHDADPKHWESLTEWQRTIILICEWQRRMFLAPEPEEDFDDLIVSVLDSTPITVYKGHIEARATLLAVAEEAFRRGQKVGSR